MAVVLEGCPRFSLATAPLLDAGANTRRNSRMPFPHVILGPIIIVKVVTVVPWLVPGLHEAGI